MSKEFRKAEKTQEESRAEMSKLNGRYAGVVSDLNIGGKELEVAKTRILKLEAKGSELDAHLARISELENLAKKTSDGGNEIEVARTRISKQEGGLAKQSSDGATDDAESEAMVRELTEQRDEAVEKAKLFYKERGEVQGRLDDALEKIAISKKGSVEELEADVRRVMDGSGNDLEIANRRIAELEADVLGGRGIIDKLTKGLSDTVKELKAALAQSRKPLDFSNGGKGFNLNSGYKIGLKMKRPALRMDSQGGIIFEGISCIFYPIAHKWNDEIKNGK
jgi:chromosome segregation ATPase